MIPLRDPIVVYAMVSLIIVALAVGLFFASPLRTLVTGPDSSEPDRDGPMGTEPNVAPEPGTHDAMRDGDGPWSTAKPTPDDEWPPRRDPEP